MLRTPGVPLLSGAIVVYKAKPEVPLRELLRGQQCLELVLGVFTVPVAAHATG